MKILTAVAFLLSLFSPLAFSADDNNKVDLSPLNDMRKSYQGDMTLLKEMPGENKAAVGEESREPAQVAPKILYEEDKTLLTSVVQVVVFNGASDDPPGKNGLANMVGEMMLRGTKKKKRTAFQTEIERLGARLTVRTSHDMTVFTGRVIKENTLAFLNLLHDAITSPAFDKKELEALRKEDLAEISHLKNNNGRLSGLALRRTLMAGTVLERPTEGSLSTVKSITHDDILRVYNDNYNRGNFIFAMASALPESEVRKPLIDAWLKLPDGTRRARKSFAPKVPDKPTLLVVNKPKTSTGSILFGQAGITAGDPDRYKLLVGNFSFGGEPLVSRLFRIVRGELGWTYAVGSTYNATGPLSNQQGFYVISTTPSVEFTAKTILKVLQMWRDYLDKGLSGDELELARESLINSYPFEFDSAEKRLWQKLYSYVYGVPMLSPEEYAKTIGDVSNGKLVAALKQKASPEGWLVSIVADRAVVDKLLAEEQKDIPVEKRITVTKQVTPEELVQ